MPFFSGIRYLVDLSMMVRREEMVECLPAAPLSVSLASSPFLFSVGFLLTPRKTLTFQREDPELR
jgi:hypothetical protein